jgi:hypothetical protein
MRAVSSAVHALALAESLGAPRDGLEEALGRLSVVLGVPLTQRAKRAPEPVEEPERPEEEPAEESAWDPDPVETKIEATRCRALLLTIIQRAMHDWVMYRTSSKVVMRQLAENAYIWLFEEKPGHPWWERRKREGYTITGFLAICEVMEVDPDFVRYRAKRLTPQEIMTAGRPAERRRRPAEPSNYVEHSSQVDLGSLESNNHDYDSRFEAHYAVSTPGYQ